MSHKIVIILVVALLLIGSTSAASLKEGTTTSGKTQVEIVGNDVTFKDTVSGLSGSSTIKIDGTLLDPVGRIIVNGAVVWTTGGVNPDATFKYTYTDNTLKETIILKNDKDLKFPLKISKGSKIIPWYNGEWKIVSATSGNTMEGITLSKPFGIDANGNRVEMSYSWDGKELSLDYNRTLMVFNSTRTELKEKKGNYPATPEYDTIPISYPLTIDPTWSSYNFHWKTTDGGYTVEMWNVTGTTAWAVPANVTSVQYLIVAGGGGGGTNYGGGGGAGGQLNGTTLSVSGSVTVTVGANGINGNGLSDGGTIGGNSVFGALTAIGGGTGSGDETKAPHTGGSGGGANYRINTVGAAGTPGQGNAGGDNNGESPYRGGGGGGAGGIGGIGGNGAGTGGVGITSSITGESVTYSTGGEGGLWSDLGVSGGGYGGGGGGSHEGYTSGVATSGVVIIRYPSPPTFTTNPTITHGFGTTPTYVLVTGTVPTEILAVVAKDATTFTLVITKPDGSPGTAQWVYWCVG